MKKGDRVICIESAENDFNGQRIIREREYIVHDVMECCGRAVSVGQAGREEPAGRDCPLCGCTRILFKEAYWDNEYFRKVEEKYRVVKIAEKLTKEEPILN